jgi:ABC-2 type transport system permease protein
MLRDIWTKTLFDQRRALAGWAVGLAFVSLGYAAFYPAVNDPALAEAMANFPQGVVDAFGLTDLTSPAGYLGSTVFGLLAPVLTLILATATGARAVAGDEEAGALELLLTLPVSRGRIVWQRALSLAIVMALAGLVVFLALLAIRAPAEFDQLSPGNLAAACAHLALLGLTYGTLALAVGSLTGRRGLALAVTAVAAVLGYMGNTMAAGIDRLAWLQDLSPFFYYSGGEPLRNGVQWGDAAVLLATSTVFVVVAAITFNRRDVGV